MENEVRLIGCRSCDERNCKGCNVYTLYKMLQRGEFDCMMDEHHSIVLTPEALRPKGQWVYDECNLEWACSECLREAHVNLGAISGYILSDY